MKQLDLFRVTTQIELEFWPALWDGGKPWIVKVYNWYSTSDDWLLEGDLGASAHYTRFEKREDAEAFVKELKNAD